MRIYQKRRKNPSIVIIPLLDILTILLIFFVATTSFKRNQTVLKITPPKGASIPTQTTGESESVALTVTSDGQTALGSDSVAPEALAEALKKLKTTQPQTKLTFNADAGITLEKLVSIWDAMIQAGYQIDDAPVRILKPQAASAP